MKEFIKSKKGKFIMFMGIYIIIGWLWLLLEFYVGNYASSSFTFDLLLSPFAWFSVVIWPILVLTGKPLSS